MTDQTTFVWPATLPGRLRSLIHAAQPSDHMGGWIEAPITWDDLCSLLEEAASKLENQTVCATNGSINPR